MDVEMRDFEWDLRSEAGRDPGREREGARGGEVWVWVYVN
jgi:hypothetical protein